MELMLQKVQRFALDSNVHFSTDPDPSKSKSKLISVCGRQIGLAKPAPLYLCGRPLPFVATALHLGHKIHESGDMSYDASVKRAILIGKSVEVLQIWLCTLSAKGTQRVLLLILREPGWLGPQGS